MTVSDKLQKLKLTLRLRETMTQLWQLRVKETKQQIAELTRESKKLAKNGNK